MVSKGVGLFLITCSSAILSLALCDCMWVISVLHPSFSMARVESQRMWSDLFLNRGGDRHDARVRHPYQAGLESPTSPNDASWCRQGFCCTEFYPLVEVYGRGSWRSHSQPFHLFQLISLFLILYLLFPNPLALFPGRGQSPYTTEPNSKSQ